MSDSASDENDYEHVSDDEINSGHFDKNGVSVVPMGTATMGTTLQDTGNYATIPDDNIVNHIQGADQTVPKPENASPVSSVPINKTSTKSDDDGYESIPFDKNDISNESDKSEVNNVDGIIQW